MVEVFEIDVRAIELSISVEEVALSSKSGWSGSKISERERCGFGAHQATKQTIKCRSARDKGSLVSKAGDRKLLLAEAKLTYKAWSRQSMEVGHVTKKSDP